MVKHTMTQLKDDEFVKYRECNFCEGTGDDFSSCCGDDMRNSDHGICPSCGEHADYEPRNGDCQECGGTGDVEMTADEIREMVEEQFENKQEL